MAASDEHPGSIEGGESLDGGGSSLSRTWDVLNEPLSRFRPIVGLLAGLISISGTLFSIPQLFTGAPGMGEVVAVVRDAKSDKPVPDATIEILNPQNALVATLTPNASGRAPRALKEGPYRVRVSHPRFAAEVRQVHVQAGRTAEVRVRLRGLNGRAGLATPLREPESDLGRKPEGDLRRAPDGGLRPSVSPPHPRTPTQHQSP